jgi:hypothetical protein
MCEATSTTRPSSAASVSWTSASSAASFLAALIFPTACVMFATACAWSRPSAHMSRATTVNPRNLSSAAMLRGNDLELQSLPSLLNAVATFTSSRLPSSSATRQSTPSGDPS